MIGFVLFAAGAFVDAAQDYNYGPPPQRQESLSRSPDASKAKSSSAIAPAPILTSPPGRSLRELPNISISYVNVAGRDGRSIQKALAKMTDASGQPRPADIQWTINVGFDRRTENGQCKIAAAKAQLKPTAVLPKLAQEAGMDATTLNNWRAYVAEIEVSAAADLWFVNDHLQDVENALMASSCEGVDKAGTAALERLKQQEAEFRRQYAAQEKQAQRKR